MFVCDKWLQQQTNEIFTGQFDHKLNDLLPFID